MKCASHDGTSLPALDLNEKCIEQVIVQVDIEEPVEVSCYQHHGHFLQPWGGYRRI